MQGEWREILLNASEADVYSIASQATKNVANPSHDNRPFLKIFQCETIVPGCTTHALIDISEILIPLDGWKKALWLSFWPRNATNAAPKDTSMLLASKVESNEALSGVIVP